jgi:potassium-transporting ATPase KdpC subunit
MKKIIYLSFISMVLFTLLTGLIYPMVITGISKIFFSYQSDGSLIKNGDKVIGSELIGQKFDTAIYFNSRPSAIDDNPYPSGASNWGPTSDTLKKTVEQRRKDFASQNNVQDGTYIPDDAIFASGSGVDPDISLENAMLQVNRIAKARNFDENKTKKLNDLVLSSVTKSQFGILGETRVNVLQLNILLDQL